MAPPAPPAGFCQRDRALLLATPRIGPGVVERLEQAGFGSLEQMRRVGIEAVVARVCASFDMPGWTNRRSALSAALKAALK